MTSKRVGQVNELIRQEISQFFIKELEFPRECLVTVIRAETSPDLEHAKIWLSVLPASFQGKVLKILKKNIYRLQKTLDRKLVMHFVPKIRFVIDHSQEKADRINTLLDSLKPGR